MPPVSRPPPPPPHLVLAPLPRPTILVLAHRAVFLLVLFVLVLVISSAPCQTLLEQQQLAERDRHRVRVVGLPEREAHVGHEGGVHALAEARAAHEAAVETGHAEHGERGALRHPRHTRGRARQTVVEELEVDEDAVGAHVLERERAARRLQEAAAGRGRRGAPAERAHQQHAGEHGQRHEDGERGQAARGAQHAERGEVRAREASAREQAQVAAASVRDGEARVVHAARGDAARRQAERRRGAALWARTKI